MLIFQIFEKKHQKGFYDFFKKHKGLLLSKLITLK